MVGADFPQKQIPEAGDRSRTLDLLAALESVALPPEQVREITRTLALLADPRSLGPLRDSCMTAAPRPRCARRRARRCATWAWSRP